MEYLQIHKADLTNLEYSLHREILRTNRAGSYASYSIAGCNTRKYHGLLICPLEQFNNQIFVLLSGLDLTVIDNQQEFNLSLHKFQGDFFSPKGHKYLNAFTTEEVPQFIYKVGGISIMRESCLVTNEKQVLVKYSILESDRKIKLRFSPYLAFRNIHELSKANDYINKTIEKVPNGIKSCLYDKFPSVYLQFSKPVNFASLNHWYYNIEYIEEVDRGYESTEDLFVPGYFETELSSGESIIFSASLDVSSPQQIVSGFVSALKNKIPRDNIKNCLINSASQFFIRENNNTYIKTGYHWYNSESRCTFISLPGLCLTNHDSEVFFDVIDSSLKFFNNGLFPDDFLEENQTFTSADTSLWFIWALQQFYLMEGNADLLWTKYGKTIRKILNSFLKGIENGIKMQPNGLLSAGEMGQTPTWMNGFYKGRGITPRIGMSIELNALWYNSICFSLELASKIKNRSFINKWKNYPDLIKTSIIENFWSPEKKYCADNIFEGKTDWSLRPNQVIAISMPYCPFSKEQKHSVLELAKTQLLTIRGLRTLAPGSPGYKGRYEGNAIEREYAMHQGAAYPWLLQHYCTAYLSVFNDNGKDHIKQLLNNLEPAMFEHGIGSVSELYDGDPPNKARGSISQAASVAAVLNVIQLIENID